LLLGDFAKLRKASPGYLTSEYLSVFPCAWDKSVPTGRIFTKYNILFFFSKIYRENTGFIKNLQE